MKIISRQTAITAVVLGVLISPMVSEAEVSTNLQAWMRRISAGEFGAGRSGGRGSAGGGSGQWVDGGDDNVHFQGTQPMLNRLIDLKKQFSFMEYPNPRHGISGEHIDTLRYGFLQENLPAGGR